MTITVGGTTISMNSGAVIQDPPGTASCYLCRAWVNFNGTGTVSIRGSGNVSSITDNGTGDYTVNFSTAMTDADYGAHINGSNSASNSVTIGYLRWNTTAPTTSAARIGTTNDAGTSFDVPYVCVTIIR